MTQKANPVTDNAKCAFCLNMCKLSMSHAIPLAAFKTILKAGSGKAIAIPYGDENAHMTQDTGAAPLLCSKCEETFNQRFDSPMSNALKTIGNKVEDQGNGAAIEFSNNQMGQSITSIVWRIFKSSAPLYQRVPSSPEISNRLKTLITGKHDGVLQNCSIGIQNLIDPRPVEEGGFSFHVLEQLIMTPQLYFSSQPESTRHHSFMIEWTMFGFLVTFIYPRLPYAQRSDKKFLRRGKRKLLVQPISIFDHAPLKEAVLSGYAAKAEGRIAPSLAKRDADRALSKK